MPSAPPLDADLAAALGRRLRALREAAGKSQEAVAHDAGISRNHMQVIEMGLSDRSRPTPWNPHLSTLVALCAALDVSVTDVIRDVFGEPGGVTVEYQGNGDSHG